MVGREEEEREVEVDVDVEELTMDRSDSLHRPRLAWLRCARYALPPPCSLLPATNHSPLAALPYLPYLPPPTPTYYACRCRRCAAFTLTQPHLPYLTYLPPYLGTRRSLHFGASAPKKIYLTLTVQRRLTNTCMPRSEYCPHKTRVS